MCEILQPTICIKVSLVEGETTCLKVFAVEYFLVSTSAEGRLDVTLTVHDAARRIGVAVM